MDGGSRYLFFRFFFFLSIFMDALLCVVVIVGGR